MARLHSKTRRAFLAALGVALTTLTSFSDVATADDSGFRLYSDLPNDQVALMPAYMQQPGEIVQGGRDIGDLEEIAEDAAETSVEEDTDENASLIEELEKLKEQLAEVEESVEEVAEVAGNKSIVISGTKNSTLKISGRVHVDAWGFSHTDNVDAIATESGDDEPNRFEFRRLRFGVKGKIKDNMIYKIEMEFGGGNDSEFRDSFLGWTDLPYLQEVLLGNQKRPYGLDHLNSSRYNVFLERPFVVEAFNEDARRLGIQSYGVSNDKRWNWRYGVFNGRNIQDEGEVVSDHLQLELAGRLATTFWYDEISGGRGYGHFAVSGTHSDVSTNLGGNEDNESEAQFRTRPEARTQGFRWLDTGTIADSNFYNLIGLEGVFNVGPFQLVGEYQHNWLERFDAETVQLNGGYFYVSYFLTGEHIPWDRESGTLGRVKPFQNFWLVNKCDGCTESGWGALQIAARYSVADFDDEDISGGEAEALSIGLNWHWNPNARVQVNYIRGAIEDRGVTVDDQAGGPLVGRGFYDIWGARFMVDF